MSYRPHIQSLSAVAITLALGGCTLYENLDDFPYVPADAAIDMPDVASDMSDMAVLDMSEDMTVDMMPDVAADMPVDMALIGMTCPDTDGDTLAGNCDPVTQEGCMDGFACVISLMVGPPPVFSKACSEIDPLTWIAEEGEACGNDRCLPGMQCVGNVCRTYCKLDDASGCRPDQFCRRLSPDTDEIGYCSTSCI